MKAIKFVQIWSNEFLFFRFSILTILAYFAQAQIRILQPPHLVKQFPPGGLIKGSTAAFGTPYWGEQLLGRLSYAVSKGDYYCTADDYDLPELEASSEQQTANGTTLETLRNWPRIVVVRRGKCHFAEKVKVAQDHKAASAVIILDEEGSQRVPSEIRTIIMADDGLGSKIRIPSILISDFEGRKLVDVLQTGQAAIVELLWDMTDTNTVQVDMWITPAMSTSLQFLQSFAPFARTLRHRINFKPHFFVFNLPSDANSMCLDTSAKLCSMPPDWRDESTDVTGMKVLQEMRRLSCLWLTTKSTIDVDNMEGGVYSEEWWNYVEEVFDRCLRPPNSSSYKPFDEECSYDLMRDLKVDVEKVALCIDSLGTAQLISDLYNHAWSPTALMINDARFAGPLDAFVVARAICTGFRISSSPEICSTLKAHHIHDVLFHKDPYIFGESFSYHKGGVAWWVYTISVVAVLLICIGVVVTYRLLLLKQRAAIRYEVFEEVKSQLTEKIATQHRESSVVPSQQKQLQLSHQIY